jgi:hypothetical protein
LIRMNEQELAEEVRIFAGALDEHETCDRTVV